MGSLGNPGLAHFNLAQPNEAQPRTQPKEPNPTHRTSWVNPPKAWPIGWLANGSSNFCFKI